MIKIKNIYKSFNKGRSNEVKAVNDVTIDFPDKGIVTLFGHSGSGKTTILNIVGGLDKPTKGEILFEGQMVKDFDQIRSKRIGYVFQNYNLFNNLSVFDNVSFVLKMLGINDEEFIKERVEYTLDLVNMLPFKRKKANELSGGQQQRVAIARALVKNPDFIIADEPTGNIDSKNKIEVMNILRKISEHKLVILVTHEENIAKYYSDRIITLVDGKITNDVLNKSGVVNEFTVDNQIYLSDLKVKETIEKDNLLVEYFGDNKNKLKVSLIFQDGTLYIKSSDNVRVDLLNENSRVTILEERLPELNGDISDTDFQYEDITIDQKYLGKRKLFSFKNNVKVSFSKLFNQSIRGKLLIFALMLSGLLMAIGVIRFGNIFTHKIPEASIEDKDFYYIDIDDSGTKTFKIEDEGDLFLSSGSDYYYPNMEIYSVGNNQNASVLGGRVAPVDEIKATELLVGRMPENQFEIVITNGIAKKLLKQKQNLGFYTIEALIGRKITLFNQEKLVISGICNRESEIIFTNRDLAKAIIATLTFQNQIENAYFKGWVYPMELFDHTLMHGVLPNIYQNQEIEVVISDGYWKSLGYGEEPFAPFYVEFVHYNESGNTNKVDDNFSFQNREGIYKLKVVGVTAIKSTADAVLLAPINSLSKLNDKIQNDGFTKRIFTTDKNLLARLSTKYQVQSVKDVQLKEDMALRRTQFAGILTFTIIILLLSSLGYFFINKSEMLRHIYQINVYRSLGVRKSEIVKTFVVDIMVLTTVTSLVGYLLTVGVFLKLTSGSLGEIALIRAHFPTLILGILVVYLINILSGIIPVLTLLRKSPAEIMRTYDF